MMRAAFTLVALGFASAASAAPVQATIPHDAVRAFYNEKVKEADRPFGPALRALWKKADAKARRSGEVLPCLDFDVTVNAQDYDDDFRKTVQVNMEPGGRDRARATVFLRPLKGQPELRLIYEVTRENGVWMVDDIINPAEKNGWRYTKLLECALKGAGK